MTAAELIASLNRDPNFVARREAQDHSIAQRELELKAAEKPLLQSLHVVGVRVESVWDLVNSRASYLSALPVLIDHLAKPYPTPIREGIARALATPEASFGWRALVDLFRSEIEQRVKDGLAVALSATVKDDTVDELIALAQDDTHGPSRLLLLNGLKRSGTQQARRALLSFTSDPVLSQEARRILSGKP